MRGLPLPFWKLGSVDEEWGGRWPYLLLQLQALDQAGSCAGNWGACGLLGMFTEVMCKSGVFWDRWPKTLSKAIPTPILS